MDNESITPLLKQLQSLSGDIQRTAGTTPLFSSLSRRPPESADALDAVERRIGMPMPQGLRDLFSMHGAFYGHVDGDGMAVGFFDRPSYPALCGGLVQVLDATWGWGNLREEEYFPQAAVDAMNASFVAFGHFMENEDCFQHFYFDRQGHFGTLKFDQDFRDADAWRHLLELRGGVNRHRMSLGEVLGPFVLRVLEST